MFHLSRGAAVSALLLVGVPAVAMFPDDVVVTLPPEAVSCKATKKDCFKFTIWSTVSYQKSNFVPARAKATVRFYLSDDATLDDSDLPLCHKRVKVRTSSTSNFKKKFTLTPGDAGKYLLAVTESAQDHFTANNVTALHLPAEAFGTAPASSF